MNYKELRLASCRIRKGIIDATHSAKSGHPGGSLSAADVFCWLYKKEMRIDPANPTDPKRDRFVLSKGHTAPGLYSTLAEAGFFPYEELKTLRKIGSRLQGHPNMRTVPGVDMSTGSLGQGVSAAVGMALAGKISGADYRVYTLLGDGEIQEGQVWEALMSAAHFGLSNLCVIIDNNGLQIDGSVADVMSVYPINEKVKAFGLEVIEVDGHSFSELESAFARAKTVTDKPTCILMHTTKGKGVSFMEGQAGWHGKAPNDEQRAQAIAELDAEYARIEAEEDAQ